jgi:hypothetical protein
MSRTRRYGFLAALCCMSLVCSGVRRASAAPPSFESVQPSREGFGFGARPPGRRPGPPGPPGPNFRGFGLWGGPVETPLYEKFELAIDIRATFDNPYDPEQVDLTVEFTSPSGKRRTIWGFYCPSSTQAQWLARFSPDELGTWKYVARVRDSQGEATSDEGRFEAVASRHRGFVGVAPNKRYLCYSDGSSFYGVGLWFNDGYHGYRDGQVSEESLDELQRLGVNFISFFSTPLETRGTGLGRYDQGLARRLDRIFEWCEARDVHISWNLIFHSFVAEDVWGPGNSWYRNNPYRGLVESKDFFASPEAWKYQEKLYRYTIARWGYSRALFLWFVVDEINGTEGFQTPERVKSAEAWCRRMNDFFHAHDPYGRPTTGTQSGGVDQWWPEGYKIFDVAAREIYESQGHPMPEGKADPVGAHPLRTSYGNYAAQCQALWKGFEKPAIIAETGWDHTHYEPGTPGYLATFHNALWTSLVNGSCSTPFWWAHSSWYLNDSILTGQLRSLAGFVADIDFAGRQWTPHPVRASEGDAWAMRSGGQLFGWFVNPLNGVAKETITIEGLEDGRYQVFLYRTWRGWGLPRQDVDIREGRLAIEIPELKPVEGRGQNIGDDVAFKIYRDAANQ